MKTEEHKLPKHYFSAYWHDKLGEALLQNARLEREAIGHGYGIFPNRDADMQKSLAEATSQGIDSHLEAIFFTEEGGTYYFEPESLCVLVRRLMESDNEDSVRLGCDICETLEIHLT